MRKIIEFQTAAETARTETSYRLRSKPPGRYRDEILKPEYRPRKLRFGAGQTWVRIVPPVKDSTCPWNLELDVQAFTGGQFVHPRIFERGAQSVFDHAYRWMRQNCPEMLYSKANDKGIRLLTDPYMLCWVLVEENNETVARLLYAKGHDSCRGGVAGLGYQLSQAARETDQDGNVVADGVDADTGFKFCVEKTQMPGARYPSLTLRASHVPAPIKPLLEKMSDEEINALEPLDQVVQRLTEEEQWECLQAHLDPDTFAKIREHCAGKKVAAA